MNVNKAFSKSLKHRIVMPWIDSIRFRKALSDVPVYALFLGNSRTGHTLVGSLLDAHPNAVISHELNGLKYIARGISKYRYLSTILHKSRYFADIGSKWQSYDYLVPNGWQGKFKELRVIGDKKANKSTLMLRQNGELIDMLQRTVDKEIRIIHVIRNPFDCITTKARRTTKRPLEVDEATLERISEMYFANIEKVEKIKKEITYSVFDLYFELFLKNPREVLSSLCAYLELPVDDDYLDACLGIIVGTPHKSRHDIDWPVRLIERIETEIAKFELLSEYGYAS